MLTLRRGTWSLLSTTWIRTVAYAVRDPPLSTYTSRQLVVASAVSDCCIGLSINQSINQSCIFRVVQVIESLQDPVEVGNTLTGINDNVTERGLEQKYFSTLMEGRQRRGRYHVIRQIVPDGGSGDCEGPAADGRQFNGHYRPTTP